MLLNHRHTGLMLYLRPSVRTNERTNERTNVCAFILMMMKERTHNYTHKKEGKWFGLVENGGGRVGFVFLRAYRN